MKNMIILVLLLLICGCTEDRVISPRLQRLDILMATGVILPTQITSDNTNILQPDGYGLGTHINRYGQPVQLRPDFGYVPGEQLQIQTDAYGPGVHMDQYGRPVREY